MKGTARLLSRFDDPHALLTKVDYTTMRQEAAMITAATDLDVDNVLAAAAAVGRDPGRGHLQALTISLRDAASGRDCAALRSAVIERQAREAPMVDP